MKTLTNHTGKIASVLITSTVILASCSSDDNTDSEQLELQIVDQEGNAITEAKAELLEGNSLPLKITDNKGALVIGAKLNITQGKDIIAIGENNTIIALKEGTATVNAILENYKSSINFTVTVTEKTEIEFTAAFAKAIEEVLKENAPKPISGSIFKKSDLAEIKYLWMNYDETGYNGTTQALKTEDLGALKYFSSLKILELGYHEFGDNVAIEVPENLESLSLAKYQNKSIKTVSIKGIKELASLDLSNNDDLVSVDLNGGLLEILNVNRCYAIKDNLLDIISKTQAKEVYANVLNMQGELNLTASRLENLNMQDHKFSNVIINAPKLHKLTLNSEETSLQDINLGSTPELQSLSIDYLDIKGKLTLPKNTLTSFQANNISGITDIDFSSQTKLETFLILPVKSHYGKITLDLRFCSQLYAIDNMRGCNVLLVKENNTNVLDFSRLDNLDNDYGKVRLADMYNYAEIQELWVNKKYEGQLDKFYALGSNGQNIVVKYVDASK
ncbi:hypothetical protein [Myroides injenensis]|uniref:hypothetical protein n=1 Tax=Myroides injenensis TaxID=1183151 RepID=UPI000288FC87|nr:hypothetical protein [Myroides injenensis]